MIKIFTFHFNNPEFLEKQYHAFKKHLKEPHELICINNASHLDKHSAIYAMCAKLELRSFIPKDVNHRQAGWSHQTALNWVWQNLVVHADDTVIIVDHDIFPIKEFKLFKDHDVAAVMQGRGEHIKYFHPTILIVHPSLKDRQTVDFMGDEIDGYRCDSGGNWHHYIQAHPELKIKEISITYIEDESMGDYKFELFEDFMLHFRGGSNWCNLTKEKFDLKVEKLENILNSEI